jgi:PAS domain S-box-containing protein
MNVPSSSMAKSSLWVLSDAGGVVSDCAPGSAQLLGKEPRGCSLAELFGEALARELLSGPEAVLEWKRSVSGDSGEHAPWRVERHRLVEGGVLVRAQAPKALQAEVPAAWDRRISRVLASPHVDVAEQQRAFMLSVFDADPNLIFVRDYTGRFIFVNRAMAETYSSTPDELVLAQSAEKHRNERENKVFDEVDRKVLSTLLPVRKEVSFTRANGEVAWYDTHKRPLRAPNGETYVLGIAVDITERRRIEQLLHEAHQRLELAIGAGQLGLWDWKVGEGAVYLSPIWKAQVGYEDHELPDTFEAWMGLLHPEDRERVPESVLRHVKESSAGDRFLHEFRMRAKDGSWRWIAGYGLVVRGEGGRGVRVTGYHVDITERKEREAEQEQLREGLRQTNAHLERLAKMKDEFFANMSHELRTPLNAVLGQAEAMEEGIFGPITPEQRTALTTIEESGRHLLSLINDVLDITKSTVGHLELDFALVPVEEVCQESLRLVREQARRRGISVTYASEGVVPNVWADRRRLRQVLINLLSNATKFTPDGGQVGLSVKAGPDGTVAFTVWDTGLGIPEEDRARIFEPFVQLDSGLARRHEGSGLGLALVRRLVALHQGQVELESEVGKGSRFTVVLGQQQGSEGSR